jgi:uncharacterized protein YndB with AHSA1/START domain
MSCDPSPAVHRTVDLPAGPEAVWDAVVEGEWLGDDVELDARPGGVVRVDDKVGVVEATQPGRSITFSWTARDRDEPPSRVDIEIMRVGEITRLWVRETRIDVDVKAIARPFALSRG